MPLSLVLGVAANDPTSVAVANTAADQLRNVGITASVSALDPVALYGDALTNNRVDAVVGWHQAGGDLATALASRYGCRALEATPIADGRDRDICAADADHDRHATTSAPPGPTTTATATTTRAPRRKPASWSRRQAISPASATAAFSRRSTPHSTAAEPINAVITAVEPRLWNLSTVLPILQDTTIVAAGPSVQNVKLSGAVPIGIVGDAGTWVKTRQ